jgi:hypothetical protein
MHRSRGAKTCALQRLQGTLGAAAWHFLQALSSARRSPPQ